MTWGGSKSLGGCAHSVVDGDAKKRLGPRQRSGGHCEGGTGVQCYRMAAQRVIEWEKDGVRDWITQDCSLELVD